VSGTDDDVSFAGSNLFPATTSEPTKVKIAVWDENSSEDYKVTLQEDDTFQIARQTWRLDAIHDDGRGWYADLTRIA